MKYTEAITALIDAQYAKEVEYHAMFPIGEAATRDEVATTRTNIRISATVMNYLREDALYDVEGVEWGTFDNCREYGLTVSVHGWTFAAYEHRNSDAVVINGCPTAEVHPYGPCAADGDKWDVLADFPWRAEYYAGIHLAKLIQAVADSPEITRTELAEIISDEQPK